MSNQDAYAIRILSYGVKAADQFTVNPRNARLHPQFQRDVLKSALSQVGFIAPVIENQRTGYLVDGHERLWQALAQGDQTPVPYVSVELDEAEEAYALATFDPITNLATYDPQLLAGLLVDVPGEWVDTQEDDGAVQRMLSELATAYPLPIEVKQDAGAQVDKAAELQQVWQVQRGDLWTFESKSGSGVHRLLCGDSRNTDDIQRLCPDKVQGVFTSPPYAEQRKAQYGGVPTDEYVAWWDALQSNVHDVLKDDGSFFVNIKPHCEDDTWERSLYVMDLVVTMKRQWDWRFIDEFCWLRNGVPKKVIHHFKNGFEPVYQFSMSTSFKFNPDDVRHYSEDIPTAGGAGVGETNWANKQGKKRGTGGSTAASLQGQTGGIFGTDIIEEGLAYPSNIIRAFQNTEALGHAAAFPIPLAEFFIKAYSDTGDMWLDPFMGSGTVFVAAEQNRRIAYGMELKPEYCSVICQRLSDMGLDPKRA